MILGIDFDRVLFDTDSFNDAMEEDIEGFHHTVEEPFDQNGNYSPEKHAEILGIPPEKIYQGAAEKAEEFLYPDVERLEELSCDVVIVSRGESRFQETKIENSGIMEHVNGFVVIESGSKDLDEIDLLVDDREKELEKVSIPTFRFDREKHGIEDVIEWVEENEA
jgi:FMN phosphatase YigB (HAD superfamily)